MNETFGKFNIKKSLFFFILLYSYPEAFEWKEIDKEYELSYQLASGFEENGITRSRPYFVAKFSYSESCNEKNKEDLDKNNSYEGTCLNNYEASFRLWNDFARVHYKKNIDIRSLFFQRAWDKWSFKIGFQEVAWGETFGLFIADIVNPRQLTDPFFNELSYIRIPVFMMNVQYYNEPWSLQIITTPIPMNNILPSKGDPFDVFPQPFQNTEVLRSPAFKLDRWGKDGEYGAKIGCFFESGVDLSLFYFRHWNRFPVYRLIIHEFRAELKPVLRRINTLGATFSKAFENIVLRGDTVLNFRQPWTVETFGIVKQRFVMQSIVGLDYMTENNMTLGFQYHWDFWREGDLHSASFKLLKDFGKKLQFHILLFFYKGINNKDIWAQPQFIWDVNDSLSLSLRADFFGGKIGKGTPSTGFIGPYRHKERAFLWMTYNF